MSHPEPVADPRVSRVEHDAGFTAGSQDADRLGDRLPCVRRMVQDAPRIHAVERGFFERKGLCVRGPDLRLEPFERQPAPHEVDGMLGQVDAGRDGAGAHEADEVRPEPDADLEEPLVARPLEVGEPVDVRIELVADPLDLGEELRRAFGRRRVFGPAGLLLPEVPDPRLLIYCRRRRGHRPGLY